jgi:hypothetical protein
MLLAINLLLFLLNLCFMRYHFKNKNIAGFGSNSFAAGFAAAVTLCLIFLK